MSEAYERFVNNKLKEKNKQQIPSKFKQHVISFDSEDESQRSDIPHIFLDKQQIEVQRPKIVKERIEKKQKKDLILSNQSSMQELKPKNLINKLPNKLVQTKNKLSSSPSKSHEEQLDEYFKQEQPKVQSQQEQEIAQPEIYVEPHSSLSFVETIQLHLGQFVFRNSYPMKKIIYINNNNQEQNILNKRDYQMRYKNEGKQILYFNNSIEVSKSLFFIILMLRNIFSYFYVYLWVGILVLQFIAQKTFLNGPIQYGTEKIPMIILIIIGILIQLFADILSVYKRRKSWSENKAVYQVYHHNGKMAQWVNTKGNQIQPGHIYKVIPGSPFPTDSIALHSEHSMLHIKENHILSMLAQQPSEMALKSTLIKGINISLPISGYLDYSINTAEYSQFQIVGKLNLQEPKKQNHPINMSNVILRGSINVEQIQILCIALQTGIDSLLLKNLQYPFQHKKVSEQRLSLKSKRISDQMSLQIKQHETKIVGWPSENRIQSAVIYLIIGYLVLVVVGLIIFLITRMIRSNEYFLSASSITFSNVIIYHLTNFTLFIPVLLIPMSKLYILLSGLITQSNISTRSVEIVSQGYNQRIIENLSQQRQRQDILDNKKIIFPVVLKDYNLLPDLCDINTIVTTIDTFRDQSAFTLHSIRVRQDINHNFKTTTLDIYPEPHLDLIKKFMSVAVLSTINTQQISNYHYETGIQVAGKKYLNFQKHKNSKGQIQLNEYKVKYIFHINAIQQYPYKVIFYKPVIDQQLQFENKRVLVIIRGNPKIILDKVYGKQIKFTEESRRLYQQRGFYVQLICKTEIHQNDANEIERAYKSSQIDHKVFYRNLDKFINKVQPMGLLIFANNFFQKKIIQSEKNPILNKSMNYQKKTQENIGKHDIFTNKNLPNIIILSPPSKSTNEQYLAIYTLTNLLRHPCLFNFTLAEVGDKILHEKPNNIQKMMSQLERQRVLVWNGWDHQQISYTLDIMKKYGSKHLLYLQKDEYMFLMKQSNCAVIGGQKGYDISKYSDITLSSRSSISYLYLTQLISYDSLVLKQGLLNIYLTQISKFIFYFIFEFINLFYTRGTGLSVIKSQFYIVIEIVLFVDIFYYLNIKDSVKVQTVDKKQSFSAYIVARVILTLLQSILIIFISFYSLDTPYDSTGTTTSYQATYFCIIFSFLHILIFQKVFNIIGSSFSFYKGLIILIQILILYLGFIIVSSTDTYYYYGILTDFMKGKTLLLSFCLIWISLTFPALNMALKLIDVPAKVVKKKTSSKFY